jgi:hypothetical protein
VFLQKLKLRYARFCSRQEWSKGSSEYLRKNKLGFYLLPTRVPGLIFYNFEHIYWKTAGVVTLKKSTDQTDNIYLIVTNQLTESLTYSLKGVASIRQIGTFFQSDK